MVTAGGQVMRLATFNLLSGRSLDDGSMDPARLVEAVTQTRADVLALQEVDREQERSAGVHQATVAAGALGIEHVRYVETVRGTPGEDGWRPVPASPAAGPAALASDVERPEEGGDGGDGTSGYGIALLSRRPVAQWHVMRMPPARGRFPITVPSQPPRVLWLRDEPRAVVAAVLENPPMTLACTHLSFVPAVSSWQLRRVCRWLATLPGPRLLLGDLNQPAGIARRVSGWTPLVSAATYPAPAPRIQLDHVLASDLPAGARATGQVRRLPISDHRAVVVDLHLPA